MGGALSTPAPHAPGQGHEASIEGGMIYDHVSANFKILSGQQ
jgi:hypothetical protein